MQKDIFIQARMSSTRMPGKVLFDIQNIPILVRTINRIRRCKIADNIVVITSTNEKDGEIEKYVINFLYQYTEVAKVIYLIGITKQHLILEVI